ncbi:MAG: dihydrofolate reductase family protein [Longicatena sp.]
MRRKGSILMPSRLNKIDFKYKEMKLKELYFDENYHKVLEGASTEGIHEILGRDFYFNAEYKHRPYIFNSLVTSIDGKIAFEDAPQGPLIAKNNKYAKHGAIIDYWILNLLRGSADAILVGTNSINLETKTGGTGHCYDEEIEIYRELTGKAATPLRIIVTLDGKDINYQAPEIMSKDMVTIFYTTKRGSMTIKNSQTKEVVEITDISVDIDLFDSNKIYVILSGEDELNHLKGMKILKKMGINRLLVESPTVAHIFMQEKIMDELFLNYSCVYVGGKATSIGVNCNAFTSANHPHTKLVSIHMYNEHFIYLRHKLIYEEEDNNEK